MPLPTTDFSSSKQHPVPQNIMSVEFKLIGSMTVRQFVYAATGVVGAYAVYSSHLVFIFKWPLVALISLGGLAFAFVPFENRGLDVWIRNFWKAISSPTLRAWKKEPLAPKFLLADYASALKNEALIIAPANSRARLMTYLGAAQSNKPKNKFDLAEELYLEHLNFNVSVPGNLTTTAPTTTTTTIETPPEVTVTPEGNAGRALKIEDTQTQMNIPAKSVYGASLPNNDEVTTKPQEASITEQVTNLEKLVTKIREKRGFNSPVQMPTMVPAPKTVDEVPPLLTAELKKLEMETKAAEAAELKVKEDEKTKKKQIAAEFEEMKQNLAALRTNPPINTPITPIKPIVPIQPTMGNAAQEILEEPKIDKSRSLTASPNVINGVVKDSLGKLIQGVIIIVKDDTGDPLRALKTNDLGEFVVSTPLPNGKYRVTASLPGSKFATMEVIADGRLLPTLNFVSKPNL
ncbi:MAG: carboxypeptidase regulatory-like domain-containing protein [candidate division WWE3 bacterium]|nr:carboxypeptidase regulatory-like domain-containing protein [candidate division WWE3 bacterium]